MNILLNNVLRDHFDRVLTPHLLNYTCSLLQVCYCTESYYEIVTLYIVFFSSFDKFFFDKFCISFELTTELLRLSVLNSVFFQNSYHFQNITVNNTYYGTQQPPSSPPHPKAPSAFQRLGWSKKSVSTGEPVKFTAKQIRRNAKQ